MLPTLVILHGWGSNLSCWQPLKSLLSKKLHVILPRLPEDKVRNTAAYSDWLFQKTKKLPPFILLGHSFGGQLAIDFAARYPGRVKKLILLASAGIRRPSVKSALFLPLAKLLKFAPLKFKRLAYRAIGATDYVKAGPIMKETMKLILRDDQQTNLKKIIVPTLLLWGEHDRYTPLSDGRLIQTLIPNSQLIIFPDGRHGLPFSHARQIKEKILWFIGSK